MKWNPKVYYVRNHDINLKRLKPLDDKDPESLTIDDFLKALFDESNGSDHVLIPIQGLNKREEIFKPGQRLFAPLQIPGLQIPYEVVEGDPLNRNCRRIKIRAMEVERDFKTMAITVIRSDCRNPLIEAIRRENLWKTYLGFHRIAATPLSKEL
jgi:hypothetical protein